MRTEPQSSGRMFTGNQSDGMSATMAIAAGLALGGFVTPPVAAPPKQIDVPEGFIGHHSTCDDSRRSRRRHRRLRKEGSYAV